MGSLKAAFVSGCIGSESPENLTITMMIITVHNTPNDPIEIQSPARRVVGLGGAVLFSAVRGFVGLTVVLSVSDVCVTKTGVPVSAGLAGTSKSNCPRGERDARNSPVFK